MKLVEVVYIGPDAEVKVKAANLVAGRNQPVKVLADVAAALLEKGALWREAYPPAEKPKS